MVLILSSERDNSTNKVIDWFLKWEIPFVRISSGDFFEVIEIVIDDNQSYFILKNVRNGQLIDSRKLTAYWYRRDKLKLYYEGVEEVQEDSAICLLFEEMNKYLNSEMTHIYLYINKILKKLKHVSSWFDNSINKLYALEVAKEVGLKIPQTIITTQDARLESYYGEESEVVTKGICAGLFAWDEDNDYQVTHPTALYKPSSALTEGYFPTLFQNKIEKEYELRIFYFHGRFFPSAIFSQQNEQTQIDFRNYDFNFPNRTPPVELPVTLQTKINRLMSGLGLNSGSIDMIYTKEGEYIFLEVNPIGLFEQVSLPCNYDLEMEIAKYLIHG